MAKNFYNKELNKSCKICSFSICALNDTELLCKKKGPVNNNHLCRAFKYNPLKRTPAEAEILTQYTQSDFSL